MSCSELDGFSVKIPEHIYSYIFILRKIFFESQRKRTLMSQPSRSSSHLHKEITSFRPTVLTAYIRHQHGCYGFWQRQGQVQNQSNKSQSQPFLSGSLLQTALQAAPKIQLQSPWFTSFTLIHYLHSHVTILSHTGVLHFNYVTVISEFELLDYILTSSISLKGAEQDEFQNVKADVIIGKMFSRPWLTCDVCSQYFRFCWRRMCGKTSW